MSAERVTVNFEGRVQGVGFRQNAVDIARRFAVTGYVKNLASGAVELVVEGESADIERYLAEVNARLQRYIRVTTQHRAGASGAFSGFEIRY